MVGFSGRLNEVVARSAAVAAQGGGRPPKSSPCAVLAFRNVQVQVPAAQLLGRADVWEPKIGRGEFGRRFRVNRLSSPGWSARRISASDRTPIEPVSASAPEITSAAMRDFVDQSPPARSATPWALASRRRRAPARSRSPTAAPCTGSRQTVRTITAAQSLNLLPGCLALHGDDDTAVHQGFFPSLPMHAIAFADRVENRLAWISPPTPTRLPDEAGTMSLVQISAVLSRVSHWWELTIRWSG
jgi:hypothetical protein